MRRRQLRRVARRFPTTNALAESIIGLYKTELDRNRGPWRGLDDLELATLEWVDWFNHRRLFHELGRVPPAEFEQQHYRQIHLGPTGRDSNHHACVKPGEVQRRRATQMTAALCRLPSARLRW